MEGADRAELRFANPGLRFLDQPPLALDAPLDVALGYQPSRVADVFAGTVTGLEPSFPAEGVPTLAVSGLGHLQRLRTGTKERAFPYYLPDAVIAAIVAAEHRLISMPDAAAAATSALGIAADRPRIQHQQTDEALLRAIASEYGFDLWVDGDVLNLRLALPRLPQPAVTLRWGESMLEFEPRLSAVGQILAVEVRVWVEAIKLQLSVQVGWEGDRVTVSVSPAAFGGSGGSKATLSLPDIPIDSPQDAVKWALSELRRRLNTRITARGRLIGNARVKVGDLVAIAGVGTTFSGDTYRITSVNHTFDTGGFRTAFDARKEVI
jgi:phage protein D